MSETRRPSKTAAEDLPEYKTKLFICIGILLSIWNTVSTVINAVGFVDKGHTWAAAASTFFLFFPGPVAFIVFYRQGLLIPDWPLVWRFLFGIGLIFCFPIVPACAGITLLITGERKHKKQAFLLKAFEASLDDGPQFVLRLIVVLLTGLPNKYIFFFFLSMITSFGSLVSFALRYNEQKTDGKIKWLIAFPMLVTSLAARALVLAVFIRETAFSPCYERDKDLNQKWIWGPVVIIIYILINISIFMLLGKSWPRSVIFGLCSTLIPTGYNDEENFKQLPSPPVPIHATDGNQADGGTQQSASETAETRARANGAFLFFRCLISYVLILASSYLVQWWHSETVSNAVSTTYILTGLPGETLTIARAYLLVRNRSGHLRLFPSIGVVISFALAMYALIAPGMYVSYERWNSRMQDFNSRYQDVPFNETTRYRIPCNSSLPTMIMYDPVPHTGP